MGRMRVTSLLAPGGSPKGLPYPDTEGFLAIRRGGAEGELPRRGKRSHPGVCPSRRISEISPCLAGRPGPGPYDKGRMASGYTVGAAISRPKAFPLPGGRCRAHTRRMRVGRNGRNPSAGRPVSGPYERKERLPKYAVGAAPCGRPSPVGYDTCRARPPGRAVCLLLT